MSFYVVFKKQIVEGLELKEGSEFKASIAWDHPCFLITLITQFILHVSLG